MERKVYSVTDVQKAFGIGRTTAYRWFNSGKFPVIQFGKKLFISIETFNDIMSGKLKVGGKEQNQ